MDKYWHGVFLLVMALHVVGGQECSTIEGVWYNDLGSEMIISRDVAMPTRLTGEYRTAVEREAGTAGASYSVVNGYYPVDGPGGVFGFSVSWRGGASTTGWTGQCHVCNGEETIITSWLLRSVQTSCVDKWKSTLIGQDTFYRTERRDGPRKDEDTHTPGDVPAEADGRRRRSSSMMEGNGVNVKTQRHVLRAKRQTSNDVLPVVSCDLNAGDWFNEAMSKLTFEYDGFGAVTGTYESAKTTYTSQEDSHLDIEGVGYDASSYPNHDGTLSFFKAWDQGKAITGWVGQCHICQEGGEDVAILETAWLHRQTVSTCEANWYASIYGQASFRHTAQVTATGEEVLGEFDSLSQFVCDEANSGERLAAAHLMLLFAVAASSSFYSIFQ